MSSFAVRFHENCRKIANQNGYDNIGEMSANAARSQQTCAGGAGPALAALIMTILSYFD